MLLIFSGPDSFTKKEHIMALAEEGGLEAEFFHGAGELPPFGRFLEQNLFSKPKIFVLESALETYRDIPEKQWEGLIAGSNMVIFAEPALDKRKATVKYLLGHKSVSVKEFALPHGRELGEWLKKRVAHYKGQIAPKAAELLAQRLGCDRAKEKKIAGKIISVEEVFDLWQADNEIKKLLAFAGGGEIKEQDIKDLVAANEEIDVLDVIDAIGQGDKARTLALIDKFLQEEGGDEKAKIIQLNALLSDQLRNVCLVQDFLRRKAGDGEILDRTAWKSGRLFVMKKISGRLNHKKILEALKRLEALDEELKSTSLPPRVPLNLIIMQLF